MKKQLAIVLVLAILVGLTGLVFADQQLGGTLFKANNQADPVGITDPHLEWHMQGQLYNVTYEYKLHQITYSWTLNKTADASAFVLKSGENKDVNYTITAERDVSKTEDLYSVDVGNLKVKNTGADTTKLSVSGQIQYKTETQDFMNLGTVKIIEVSQLAKGVDGTFALADLQFELAVDATAYQIVISVYDANSTDDKASVSDTIVLDVTNFPSEPTATNEIDESADFSDVLEANHDGLTWDYNGVDSVDKTLSDSEVIEYTVTVNNENADSDKSLTLKNNAELVPCDFVVAVKDDYTLTVNTGEGEQGSDPDKNPDLEDPHPAAPAIANQYLEDKIDAGQRGEIIKKVTQAMEPGNIWKTDDKDLSPKDEGYAEAVRDFIDDLLAAMNE